MYYDHSSQGYCKCVNQNIKIDEKIIEKPPTGQGCDQKFFLH